VGVSVIMIKQKQCTLPNGLHQKTAFLFHVGLKVTYK